MKPRSVSANGSRRVATARFPRRTSVAIVRVTPVSASTHLLPDSDGKPSELPRIEVMHGYCEGRLAYGPSILASFRWRDRRRHLLGNDAFASRRGRRRNTRSRRRTRAEEEASCASRRIVPRHRTCRHRRGPRRGLRRTVCDRLARPRRRRVRLSRRVCPVPAVDRRCRASPLHARDRRRLCRVRSAGRIPR